MLVSTLLFLGSAIAAAKPIHRRAGSEVAGYGIDPSVKFQLNAVAADNSKSWKLVSYFSDYLAGELQLKAVSDDEPVGNFTLESDHYGTRLYAYEPAPCTSNEYCNTTAIPYGNVAPTAGEPLTFGYNVSQPNFGGLAFYGRYSSGDPELGARDLLTGANDASLTTFSLCESNKFQVLSYQGATTPEACTSVYVSAVQQ